MGMSIISKMRRQKAVYWTNPTSDGYGDKDVDLPVEIDCRWEDNAQQVLSSSGEEITSASQVYTDRDTAPGGFLMLGTLASLTSLGVPVEDVPGAHEIRRFDKLPVLNVRLDGLDPNADEYLRTAWL
jgi:hypothetical protein